MSSLAKVSDYSPEVQQAIAEYQIEGDDLTAFNQLLGQGRSPYEAAMELGLAVSGSKAIAKSKGGKVAAPPVAPALKDVHQGSDIGTESAYAAGYQIGSGIVRQTQAARRTGAIEGVQQTLEEVGAEDADFFRQLKGAVGAAFVPTQGS